MAAASMAAFSCTDTTMLRARCVSSRPFNNKLPLREGEGAHIRKFQRIACSGSRSVFIQGFSRSRLLQLSRKVFIAAAYDQPGSADLHVEGKIVEGLKDPDNVHEATTWGGERNESEKLDTELFDSLRNSTEDLQRQVENATESLAGVSKGAIEKEDIPHATESNSNQEPPRKGAKIHDFCFGIPYGGLLVGGALVGFCISRDMVATLFGLLLGGVVLGLSMTSLKVWRQGKSSTPYILGQAAISLIVLARQLQVFSLTKNVFPTGFIALISAAMLSFYSYVYASGGNPPSKKLRASAGSQSA
uniref:Protein FATTY ACID EXPORT 1, chloroplastic n=1 Tax=Picea sitchensis TaxID=3332 RepID=A9NYZ0_PICSI|nr:unknown [Picea sitchensis]